MVICSQEEQGGGEEEGPEGRRTQDRPCCRTQERLHCRRLSRSLEGKVGGAEREQGLLERSDKESWALAALLPHPLQSLRPQGHKHPLNWGERTLKAETRCVS